MSPFQSISLSCLVKNLQEKIETNLGVELLFILQINCEGKPVKLENPSDIENLTIEIAKHKNKIFVAGIYKLPNLSESDFTTNLETIISKLPSKYEKIILMGDFNMTTSNPILNNSIFEYICTFTFKYQFNLFEEFKNPKLYRSFTSKFQT